MSKSKNQQPAKVIGYVRVSTEDQAANGVSLEAQQDRIRAYCTLNGLELSEVFIDAGVSGKRADNRPELQKALDAVCHPGGVLVVYSLSRLARSTKDTIAISERLQARNADLVSLSEKIDTTSAAGKMIFRMLAVLAEFERDVISERTQLGMRQKKTRGERVGKVPFGFDLADDGVKLVPNANEQEVIGLIRELRDRGLSYRKIADHLNAQSIPSKEGGEWLHTAVQRIAKRGASA